MIYKVPSSQAQAQPNPTPTLFYSILFYSILFYSILFYSILFLFLFLFLSYPILILFTSCHQLVMLCLMRPRMGFALLAARTCCWLLLSLLSASTPRSLSAGLPSGHSSPHLYLCPALLRPKCRIQHSVLLNFIPLITAQCSSLSSSLCKASCPSRESSAPPSLSLWSLLHWQIGLKSATNSLTQMQIKNNPLLTKIKKLLF